MNLNVRAIVTGPNTFIDVAKQVTSTVPIVMVYATDPVGRGYVASLSRPGRSITDLAWDATPEIAGKCINLLTEVRPAPSRVVGIVDPGFPDLALRKGAESAAKIRSLTLQYVDVRGASDVSKAFATITGQRANAIIVFQGPTLYLLQVQISELARTNNLPTVFLYRGASGRWPDVLWPEPAGLVATLRKLRRQNPQGCEARRPARRAADEVRAGPQPQDREGARPDDPAVAAAASGSGDRSVKPLPYLLPWVRVLLLIRSITSTTWGHEAWPEVKPVLRRALEMRRQIAREGWWKWIVTAPFLLLFSGCATLTPAQSAGLKETQQFADQVTAAYGVARLRVMVGRNMDPGTEFYDDHANWISMPPSLLEHQDRPLLIAPLLASATLGHRALAGSVEAAREQRFAAYRRAVEVLVRFLGMSTRQAVDRYTEIFLARNKDYAAQIAALPSLAAIRAPGRRVKLSGELWAYFPESLRVPPCDQLRDLWSYFSIFGSPPTCETPKG